MDLKRGKIAAYRMGIVGLLLPLLILLESTAILYIILSPAIFIIVLLLNRGDVEFLVDGSLDFAILIEHVVFTGIYYFLIGFLLGSPSRKAYKIAIFVTVLFIHLAILWLLWGILGGIAVGT